jgi:DNA polymerase V
VESLFQFGYNYQKVGVILNDIIPDDIHQGNLFAEFPTAKSLHIGKAIDRINRKHGRDKVRLASQLQTPDWSMVRDSLSRQYTTDWKQLLKAK